MQKKHQSVTTSYGCILYTIVNNELYWLFMKRRDTIALIYLLKMASHLKPFTFWYYISKISPTERFLLQNYHTKDLVQEFSINKAPSHKKKIHDNIVVIKENLIGQNIRTSESEWEFPKGRSMDGESFIETAKRELIEETALATSHISEKVYSTITENYIGLNRLPYKNIFYVLRYIKPTIIKKKYDNNIRGCSISHESSDIKWISMNELKQLKCKRKYKEILECLTPNILKNIECKAAISITGTTGV